ncbi:MAG: 50S ribosomal protein L24 [Firmicutes bacterium]|nr:50S ribosomal protein L24 [Bacillota bacterium]
MRALKLNVRTGDTVIVISGKDEGKRGKILKAFPAEGKVLVEGINLVTKHSRPTRKVPQGGINKQEAPLPACKVMLICPRCHRPTRVGYAILEGGPKARVCKHCGETADK